MKVLEKVLILAERGGQVLVFDEPDFPEMPLQVPGGTLEPSETPLKAAKREFAEETGLAVPIFWKAAGRLDYRFEKNGRSVRHTRHVFLTHLSSDAPDEWTHYEQHACDGSPPIRFHLHFLPFDGARDRLGLGMNIPLFWPGVADFFG